MNGTSHSFSPPAKFADGWDQLHEAAALEAGSDDFGEDDYKWGLRVLLHSLDFDSHFTETGRVYAWKQMVDALVTRVVAFRSLRENPGYADNVIRKPIAIVGLPRTGTTALHKLLAVDPQFQGPEKWLTSYPMPRPPRESWESNPWFQREVRDLDARFGAMPGQRAGHNMIAEEIDECIWLQRHSFVANVWGMEWSAGTYDFWWQTQTEEQSYLQLRRCLQMIGMNDRDRRWLLKDPNHILHLDQLFAIFPDILVVQTHRDPAKVIPSLCAILEQGHSMNEGDRREERTKAVALREIAKWGKGARDAMPVRAAHAGQVMDVIHSEFHADPLGTVRRVYEFAGLELRPEIETMMAERVEAKPELAHGVHHYDVADFGLTDDEIREQFADYIEAFDLRPRRSVPAG